MPEIEPWANTGEELTLPPPGEERVGAMGEILLHPIFVEAK